MKAHIHNDTSGAKDMGSYLELPLKRFLKQMPQYAWMILKHDIDIEDPKYIVRFKFIKKGAGIMLEYGYPEDAEWHIGAPDASEGLSYPAYHREMSEALEKAAAEGKSYVAMTTGDFIETYPGCMPLDLKCTAVCIAGDPETGIPRLVPGDVSYTDGDWERLLDGYAGFRNEHGEDTSEGGTAQ